MAAKERTPSAYKKQKEKNDHCLNVNTRLELKEGRKKKRKKVRAGKLTYPRQHIQKQTHVQKHTEEVNVKKIPRRSLLYALRNHQRRKGRKKNKTKFKERRRKLEADILRTFTVRK